MLTLDYANGQSLTNEYFPRQLLKSTKVQKAGAYAVWFAYGHDDNGRITSINDRAVAGQNRTFAYDDVGRLTSATGPWGTGTFTYDSLGNIREKVLGARTVSFLYDPTSAFGGTGRLTSVKDTGGDNVWRAFTYDAKGNTTWHGLGLRTLAYDAAEQPTSITGNGVTGAFVYDGNLKRVKQVVNGETIYSVYGQSGALLYRDNATTGETTDYVRLGSMTVARIKDDGVTETVSYLHQNHLGSPVAATDTGGTVLWREDYTPFGEERQDPAANDNDENFTGHIRDEATGLLYMQARYMDPILGRFLSNDPVGFSDDQPQYFNRYSYTLNDPVNMHDPDGQAGQLALSAVCGPGFFICAVGIVAVSVTITCLAADCSQVLTMAEHTSGARPSTEEKHEKGEARKKKDGADGEKGDKARRPNRKRPKDHKGPWPPKDGAAAPTSTTDSNVSAEVVDGSDSSSSGGQTSTSPSHQGGSRFHGNRTSVVDGRATRLEQKEND